MYSMYQPDTIKLFSRDGSDYLLTANEGDAKEYLYDDADGEEQNMYTEDDFRCEDLAAQMAPSAPVDAMVGAAAPPPTRPSRAAPAPAAGLVLPACLPTHCSRALQPPPPRRAWGLHVPGALLGAAAGGGGVGGCAPRRR